MKNNVLFRQVVNILDDTDTWLTVLFFALAGFFSYSSWVSPAYRDEMVIATIAAAVANATGVRGVLLAYAKSHAETVVELLDEGVNAVEHVAGVNLVNDDLQAILRGAILKELQALKVDSDTNERLAKLERQINDLLPRG